MARENYQFAFEKLDVYQKAKSLICIVYEIKASFPDHEKYQLGAQVSRAVLSVASNIAEGSSRKSGRNQAHFSRIAFGSLMEVLCQLDVASELEYISPTQFSECRKRIEEIARMLNALSRTQSRKEDLS